MRRALPVFVLGALFWAACEEEEFGFPDYDFDFDAGTFDAALPDAGVRANPVLSDADVPDADAPDAAPEAGVDAGVDAGPNPVAVTPPNGSTAEDGTGFDLQVSIARTPIANVTLPVVVSKPGEATVSVASVVFTPAGARTATVQVRGVDDGVADPDEPFTVTVGPPTSTDPAFAGQPAVVVSAMNLGWVQLLKNVGFEVAPGATINLDATTSFTPDYVANGGWLGSPNAPFNTVIANGFGRDGTRGARMSRAVGTDGTHLPSFHQAIAVTAAQRTCTYRARADVRADVATARPRLLLGLDTATGAHVGGLYSADSNAPLGTWQTLSILQTGPNVAWEVANVLLAVTDAAFTGEAYVDHARLDRICKN